MESLNGCLPLLIGGKQRTLFFDYIFAELLFKEVPAEKFDDAIKDTPLRLLPLITYVALKSGEDVNDLPDDFSERMAGRWLMGAPEEKVNQIVGLFEHSMGFIMRSVAQKAPAAKPPKSGLKPSL